MEILILSIAIFVLVATFAILATLDCEKVNRLEAYMLLKLKFSALYEKINGVDADVSFEDKSSCSIVNDNISSHNICVEIGQALAGDSNDPMEKFDQLRASINKAKEYSIRMQNIPIKLAPKEQPKLSVVKNV
ncbi:hypothetical protein A7985_05525 [Pseudoalteromonas luteoviolacea]|uniref:Uncharacterized protein n=1 Tax=Pseudoalteromonas luteoviolacea TaxID=43657 RepID=A0A1C0TVP7_9GAMM|nr:hypothetical protein [Pseudoalteromonas luteoviolacea]OCQ23400.1 hypothetical protein A7985_05525 [Pseudoalteromonas luteoviolacea]